MKNIVTVNGTDQIPAHVKQILQSHKRDCTNKTYRVHDDVRSYTVLHQDISLCGGYANYANRSGAPEEVIENLTELEEDGEIYESIEDIWPDYPTKEDFFFNEEEY